MKSEQKLGHGVEDSSQGEMFRLVSTLCMSLSWLQRKSKLTALLRSNGDEDADGMALDRLLHGQNVIGKTTKTVEIEVLRFQDKDLYIVGTLEYGQFGVIDVVTCHLDGRMYVRKSTEKRFALRTRDQCFPQFERDILLQALKTQSKWAPHLLCAFQTPTHLNLVMDYAQGGSLWDVLESSPYNGKLLDLDLQWWIPQIVSAIQWCHTQGFAHRDIKPQNFVLKQDAHLLLIDFGSAAPLLPPGPDGSQRLPKRYCLVPCGTCDYISPEILRAHEAALVALEMEEEGILAFHSSTNDEQEYGYGVETDWWSFGVMLYEMIYGVAPFFSNEIRHTYQKIMNHERCLLFDINIPVPSMYKDLIRRLLTHPEHRIGRRSTIEIAEHPLFEAINWTNLHEQRAPEGLHLPQFTYNEQPAAQTELFAKIRCEESLSQGFAFSTLFQSSPLAASSSTSVSALRQKPPTPAKSAMQEDPSAAFIGFSWGPVQYAFSSPPEGSHTHSTPQSTKLSATSHPFTSHPTSTEPYNLTTPQPRYNTFSTPKNHPHPFTPFRTNTLPRSASRTVQRRDLSDREAMKQLVDCIGMSARKRVLESGRKPRILNNPAPLRSRPGFRSLRKELRFVGDPIPMPDYRSLSHVSASLSSSMSGSNAAPGSNIRNTSNPLDTSNFPDQVRQNHLYPPIIPSIDTYDGGDDDGPCSSSEPDTELTESEGPPSPSPRPASVLSMSLSLPRRSGTPTVTMTLPTMMIENLSPSTTSNATASMSLARRLYGSALSMSVTPDPSLVNFPSVLLSQVQSVDFGGSHLPGKAETSEVRRTLGYEMIKGTHPQEQGDEVIPRHRITDAGLSITTSTETKTRVTHDHTMSFKRNSLNASQDLEKQMRSITQNESDQWGGTSDRARSSSLDEDYSRLEQKLDMLMKDISNIEEKLANLRLAF